MKCPNCLQPKSKQYAVIPRENRDGNTKKTVSTDWICLDCNYKWNEIRVIG